ncbi:MAG: 4-alpha-glucanotransferase [Lachnospiraceae bacterium]|nr:4-alpha-glucanotransferase [Lachnospiraceae bacterium]
MKKERKSGVLMPVASLPGRYGIGTMGKCSYDFVDRLCQGGQSYWQILPLGPTSYGDSPYQSFSTFAGNPYFIDPDKLTEEGLLKAGEVAAYDFGSDPVRTDYKKLYDNRFKMLKKAFRRFDTKDKAYRDFVSSNRYWLEDYALYMALKDAFSGRSLVEWKEPVRMRDKKVLDAYREKYAKDIEFYKFVQYEFTVMWKDLKKYANERGVSIIGDIPIYVALDSADTWSCPEMFKLDEKGYPLAVAGCPPDAFSATGQLWGNPLYDWDRHEKTGYEWWIRRIKRCMELYDMVRVDHFRGFDEYYAIPYGDPTAEFGKWEKGPGIGLFKAVKDKLGDVDMIAEDLGFLTPSVIRLVKKTGYPGMKVLQFAFDPREESDYLPHNYAANSVVYTGTHDNDTTVGWFKTLKPADRRMAMKYLNRKEFASDRDIAHSFVKLAMSSVSNLCIIPMQDWLGLGAAARINTPSTLGGNWVWRMKEGAFSASLAKKMYDITKLYGRL